MGEKPTPLTGAFSTASGSCFLGSMKHMGVSKNWGTPKWMVYNGKPY